MHVFVQRTGAHDRRKIETIRQGVKLFQHLAAKDTHAAGAVGDTLAAQQADHPREDGVADASRHGHFALCPGHTRADHDVVAVLQKRFAKQREIFGRVGAVGVEKGQQLAVGSAEAGLQRRAVAAVDRVLLQPHACCAAHDLGRAVAGPVVHHDQFKGIDPDRWKLPPNRQHPLHDVGDAVFFVQRRDDHGQCCHGFPPSVTED